jgi:hypothetical protein
MPSTAPPSSAGDNWAGANRPPAFRALPAAGRRRDGGLDAAPSQLLAEGPAVRGFVRDQFPRPCARPSTPLRYVDRRQGRHGEGMFMRACARHLQPDRQPVAVGHHHYFRAFADLRLADARAPFFAGTKLPSRNARDHSSLLWASSWLRSARQMRSQVPSSDHCCKRRQQVTAAP